MVVTQNCFKSLDFATRLQSAYIDRAKDGSHRITGGCGDRHIEIGYETNWWNGQLRVMIESIIMIIKYLAKTKNAMNANCRSPKPHPHFQRRQLNTFNNFNRQYRMDYHFIMHCRFIIEYFTFTWMLRLTGETIIVFQFWQRVVVPPAGDLLSFSFSSPWCAMTADIVYQKNRHSCLEWLSYQLISISAEMTHLSRNGKRWTSLVKAKRKNNVVSKLVKINFRN